ncbi:MAG: site-specific integrase [Thermaceae bacterium]|nr:site-specific integrase [Thermaceae bacterium]
MPRRSLGSIRYVPERSSFLVRVTLGYRDGKRLVKSAMSPGPDTAVNRKQAEQLLSRLVLTMGPPGDELPTVGEWCAAYLETRSDLDENTLARMQGHLVHIERGIGHIRLDKLTADHLEAFYRTLPHAKGTLVKMRQLLGSAYKRALRRWPDLLRHNPVALSELPKLVEGEPGQAMTPEHVRRLLEAAYSHRLYALIYITLALGLRRGEALGLRWGDLDLEGGWAHICRAIVPKPSDQAKVGPTKTSGSVRDVPLNLEARGVLLEHLRYMEAEGWAGPHDWVFPGANGERIQPRNYNRLFDTVQRRAKLVDSEGETIYRLHDLRVTSETELIRATGNPKLVANFHGQRSVVTAVKFYHKLNRQDLVNAVEGRSLVSPSFTKQESRPGFQNTSSRLAESDE